MTPDPFRRSYRRVCPWCGAVVDAENLSAHLGNLHDIRMYCPQCLNTGRVYEPWGDQFDACVCNTLT